MFRSRLRDGLASWANRPSVRYGLGVFLALRLGLSAWAALLTGLLPLPAANSLAMDRIFLGQAPIGGALGHFLLQPWQRHDSLRYLRIALEGYANVEDSVFSPLYPLLMRLVGWLVTPLLGGVWLDGTGSEATTYRAVLAAGIVVGNIALLGFLVLFYEVTAGETSGETARRSVLRLAVFPSAFFLLAAYTESLFLLLAVGALWAGRRDRWWLAGLLAMLATWTRTAGVVLALPLLFEYLRQRDYRLDRVRLSLLAAGLPVLALVSFLSWRTAAGLPSMARLYELYWLQVTSFPGRDVLTGLRLILTGEGELRLYLDLGSLIFIVLVSVLAWFRLPRVYGVYSVSMLLFILLPHSDLKPLFSFSRYALVFFPGFMALGDIMKEPWPSRLIFYPFVALLLFFSGQFFIGGWVG
jgi:hypothetical protein